MIGQLWKVETLGLEQTFALRRRVLRDGNPASNVRSAADDLPGAWHLGVVKDGEVIATSTYYPHGFPQIVPGDQWPVARPGADNCGWWQLRFMAVSPEWQKQGIGDAILTEAIGRLRDLGAVGLWAHARDSALEFYQKFGFETLPGTYMHAETKLSHHIVRLAIGK
jgi:GNAT superfamily N-acetyltransferase